MADESQPRTDCVSVGADPDEGMELVLTLFNIMRFFGKYCMDRSWLVSESEDNMMQIFELQIRVKHLLVVILDCLTFYAEI